MFNNKYKTYIIIPGTVRGVCATTSAKWSAPSTNWFILWCNIVKYYWNSNPRSSNFDQWIHCRIEQKVVNKKVDTSIAIYCFNLSVSSTFVLAISIDGLDNFKLIKFNIFCNTFGLVEIWFSFITIVHRREAIQQRQILVFWAISSY